MAIRRNTKPKRNYRFIGILLVFIIGVAFLILNKKPQTPITPVNSTNTPTIIITATPILSGTFTVTPTKEISNLPEITQVGGTPANTQVVTPEPNNGFLSKYRWRGVTPEAYSDIAKGYSTTPKIADMNLSLNMPLETADFSIQRLAPEWYEVRLLKKPYATSRKKAEEVFIGHGLSDLSKFTIDWIEG